MEEPARYLAVFRMPRMPTITGRMSAVTNSFVNSIIPRVVPTAVEVKEVLDILGMTPETIECIYCGDPATEWDHLRPTVKGKRPTGYISEIANLVPACGKCNQSKGNSYWREWMTGPAPLAPTSRGIEDVEQRILRLQALERRWTIEPVDVEAAVPTELWESYWEKRRALVSLAREAQELAEVVKARVKEVHDRLVAECEDGEEDTVRP